MCPILEIGHQSGQKKDLVGALKNLQLHKSNIQMTTNVITPLNKTLVYKVSTRPKMIDPCPDLSLVRSG